METTLDVRGVTRRYGTREVLKGITFAAQKGEIIALLGRNGTGKSTLMNTITGYLCQSGGDISICGYDVLTQPLEARRRTGYLPEQPPLYPDMTVTEYLRYCCRLRGLKASTQTAEIARVIELTGLEAYAHRLSGRLSKGYRQRLGVAQALLGQPPLLILDEPGSGLDPLQMAQIANEELTNAGLPALYTGQYNNGTYYPSLIEIQQGKWSNTDWADLCMRTAVVNNTTATLSHSTDKAAINLSLNYFDDEGVYKKDNFRKGNVTLNGSYKLAKNFTLQTSNILSIHKRHVNNTLEYGRNPLWPVYDEDGNYFVASETDFGHPLIISDNVKNETQGRDLISSLAAEWEIV